MSVLSDCRSIRATESKPCAANRRHAGSVALETAMYLPILFLLLFGTVELGKIAYTYYTLQKILTAAARYAGTQQGVNLCDAGDPAIMAAKQFAISASLDSSANPLVENLTADMIQVRPERVDPNTGDLNECACSPSGCDAASGGLPPDFIVVSIPDGYPFAPHIPFIPTDPILLRPSVRVPYGGT